MSTSSAPTFSIQSSHYLANPNITYESFVQAKQSRKNAKTTATTSQSATTSGAHSETLGGGKGPASGGIAMGETVDAMEDFF